MKKSKKDYGAVGLEDINVADMRPSFIKLVQKSSNVEGAKPGDLVDGGTGENLGTSIVVQPVKKYIDWVKFNENNELEDRSQDGVTWDISKRPLTEDEKWQEKKINFFVYVDGLESELPYILSFGKTSFKTGKKMADALDKVVFLKKEPIFSKLFKIGSKIEENKNHQKYFVYTAEMMKEEPDDDDMDKANEMFLQMTALIKSNAGKQLTAGSSPNLLDETQPAKKKPARKY